MKKRLIFINILLLLCIGALTFKLKSDWEAWGKEHNTASLVKKAKKVVPSINIPGEKPQFTTLAQTDLAYIGDNNLFHQDRNMKLPQPSDDAPPPPPKLENPPTIFGIIDVDGQRYAQVQPQKSAKGHTSSNLAVGDTWEDIWTVKEVLDDRIVLTSSDVKEEVLFHDPEKRKNRVVAQKNAGGSPANVVTIGGGGGGTGRPGAASAMAAGSPAGVPASKPSSIFPGSSRGQSGAARNALRPRNTGSQSFKQSGNKQTNPFQSSRRTGTAKRTSRNNGYSENE